MSNKRIWIVAVTVVIVLAIAGVIAYQIGASTKAGEISVAEAEEFINKEFDKMAVTETTRLIAEKNTLTVNSISYGSEKDIILDCSVRTIDVYSAVMPHIDSFFCAKAKKEDTGMIKSALHFKMEYEPMLAEFIGTAEEITKDCTVYVYETKSGLSLYGEDSITDTVYGGIISLCNDIKDVQTYTATAGDGSISENPIESPNVNKGFIQCFELRRETEKPDVSNVFGKVWNKLKKDFHQNFIEHDRYMTILNGLWTTIKLTVCALIIGIIIGFLVAFVRCTYLKQTKRGLLLRFVNSICQIYLTVIRGTPAVVQIMLIYFVIFMPLGVDKFLSAVICFGLNSGAYVAEIVRGGIMSIDNGQTEAGRSLGFGYMATMYHIVFPQAFKAVLPALANEFVVLLKETSVAFYIGLGDLMYAGNSIRAATYSAYMPLIAVALIYFVMVLILSKLVGILERRLRNNER